MEMSSIMVVYGRLKEKFPKMKILLKITPAHIIPILGEFYLSSEQKLRYF